MNDKDDDTKEIIDSFVSESYDLIENAETKLLKLENECDEEIINVIFRLFHSLKGTAGYLNFENIKQITHNAENLLDIFRKNDIKPNTDQIDLLYQTTDFIKQLIEAVENHLSDSGYEKQTDIIVNDINKCVDNLKVELEKNLDRQIGKILKSNDNEIKADSPSTGETLITPEMIENYLSESVDILDLVEEKIIEMEKSEENHDMILEIYRNIHTFKGNSGFFGYEFLETTSMNMESILDDIKNYRITIDTSVISNLLKDVDSLRMKLGEISLSSFNKEIRDKKIKITKNEQNEHVPKKIGEILVEMGQISQDDLENIVLVQNKPLGESLIDLGKLNKDTLDKALEIQKELNSDILKNNASTQRKDVRVDTAKLDKLFDLVGEIITAGEMVTNNPDIKDLKLPNFTKAVNMFNKITRELQEITMTIRMIPLEGLFVKMTRLVRDLSKKFGKQISFSIYGQETEMDRNVIEEISDPLIHLLRNSIDHGVEMSADRIKNGKDSTGNISLGAKYEGNEIWILIEDDGAGLDRERIVNKAFEKGLITESDKLTMKDEDVWQLIFIPGFSTADKLTEISGRGVGMDVVRKNIERIRGKIDIKTSKNNGTTFILRIPLTLAIMDGVTIKVGTNFFSIPTIDILEFFRIRDDKIVTTEGKNELIKLRNEMLPIVKLHEIFKIKTDKTEITDGIILVLQSNTKKACLLIDEIIGNQQIVVKSLTNYLGNIKGVMGCSILGNGDVSLILDTESLLAKVLD